MCNYINQLSVTSLSNFSSQSTFFFLSHFNFLFVLSVFFCFVRPSRSFAYLPADITENSDWNRYIFLFSFSFYYI